MRSMLAVAALLMSAGSALGAGENVTGRWTGLYSLPLVPSSGALLPSGKVLLWSADGEFSFASEGTVQYTIFDPATGAAPKSTFSGGQNMFCTGTTVLADGRILANGGSNAATTTLFDPATQTMKRVQDMVVPRGYNANTILADGSVFTYGGTWSGGDFDKPGEIWTEAAGWRSLSGLPMSAVSGGGDEGYHYWLLPAGNGKVIYAGPKPQMKWLDTSGSGAVSDAGARGDDAYANSGIAVMYDTGRILKAGGVPGYAGRSSSATYKIDVATDTPAVTKLEPMTYPRVFANSVVLPDGKVFIVGGQTYGAGFTDNDAVFPPELWDPATERTTLMAPIAVARNYHSIALLLPDGRVLSGGGGLCGAGCAANHPDVQIFSPPYLFDAAGNLKARPSIVTAPAALTYGGTVTVTTDRPVSSFSVVRFGATTHTVNNDQRRLSLAFRQTGTNTYAVDVPSNPGWLLPGKWMLFALDGDGTPSIARVVDVSPTTIARMVGPGTIVAQVGAPIASTPNVTRLKSGVTFSGTSLPAGVTIDPQTGAIGGSPTVAGTYRAALTATDGAATISVDFTIAVDPAPAGGTGLLADYFPNVTLSGTPVLTRRESPDFNFGNGSPGAGVPVDGFSARWVGTVTAVRSGTTRFRTRSDDGVRLWVGGRLLVDDWTIHGSTDREGSIELVAGRRYPVLLEYYEGGGDGELRLNWLRPGDSGFSAIPVSQLDAPMTLPATNLALGKAARQSSTFLDAGAARAVDGNTGGVYGQGSVSHTQSDANAWWQVDLGLRANVDRVRLWNRTDCCTERLRAFSLLLSETDMAGRSYADLLADPAVTVRTVSGTNLTSNMQIPVGTVARFVRVQLAATEYLHLAEVEVFGAPANAAPTVSSVPTVLATTGTTLSIAVTASDPDGDPLTYTAANLPAGLSIGRSTGLITGAPTAGGTTDATVTVSDPAGLSASVGVRFTVTAVLPSVAKLVIAPAQAGQKLTYAPVIANGVGARYAWSFGDGTATAAATTSKVEKTYANPGNYTVTLTMTAPDGRSSIHRFAQAVTASVATLARDPASAGIAYEARAGQSARLWVVNPDKGTVGVIDLGTKKLAAEIAVGRRPVTAALRAGGEVWVVNRDGESISIIDTAGLTVKRTVALPRGSRPWGLVFAGPNADGIVALEGTRQLALVTGAGAIGGVASAGPSPRFLAAAPGGDGILISHFITPPLPGEGTAVVRTVDGSGKPLGGVVETMNLSGAVTGKAILKHSEAPDTEVSARGIPNYLGAAAVAPDGRTAWIPSKQDNVKRGTLRDRQGLDFQTTVRAVVSEIDLSTMTEVPGRRVDLDNAGKASAAVFHPSGAWLFVALETSREVAVVDPVGARELFRFGVGRAPTSLAIAPDGNTLYVQNFMDRTVSVVRLEALTQKGQSSVTVASVIRSMGAESLPRSVLVGKQFFYDAADPRLARDGYLSCAVCHENGEADGRTWDFTGFGEGLRNTISLSGHRGMGQGNLHWTANFDELQDFEGQIRSFAEGTGLMSDAAFRAGTRSAPLGDRKTGQSADLDALAAYMTSLATVPNSPWRKADGTATAAGVAGRSAFARLGCGTCHGGIRMTISAGADRLRDVGTIDAAAGKRLGGRLTGFDVPTLLGTFATAPYLHDGSALTIEAAIAAHDTRTVSATDLSNLAAYIRELEATP